MKRIGVIVLATAAVTAFGCGGSPTGPSSGNFNLRMTDNPYGSAKAVLITFSQAIVETASGDTTKLSLGTADSPTITCDLKKLENNAEDLIGVANLTAGVQYTMVRLKVEKAQIFFDNSSTSATPCAATIDAPAGAAFTMTVPSSEVKINDQAFTQSDGTTTVLLDFDGAGSIVETGNQTYILTPVIRVKSVQ